MNIYFKLITYCIILTAQVLVSGPFTSSRVSDKSLRREIQNNVPSEEAFLAVQKLAKPFIIHGEWESAVGVFEEYKHLFPDMSHRFEKIILTLSRDYEGWIIEVMDDRINTMQYNEFSPVPSYDGKYLYFATDRKQTGYGEEDVFVSRLVNGAWSPAMNIFNNINTESSEAPSSISIDGTQLILFGNYETSEGRGDLFISEYIDTVWTPVIPFPNGVNTRYYEADGVYSPDGQAFFFTSDRPEGVGDYHKRGEYFHGNYAGNLDIYVMVRNEFGTWSEPKDLGDLVNTPYCDQDPFITPDGNDLYFASDGHYGLGGLDIYKSHRISKESWTRWSEPVNLGKEINTVWDDTGYKWDASGDSAFYTIADNGKMNIYTIKHPSVLPPHTDPVKVYGMITGTDSSRVHAEITVTFADSDSVIQRTFTDSLFGVFHVLLKDNNRYKLTVKNEGYSTVSKTLNLGDYGEGESTALDFTMTRLPVPVPDYEDKTVLFDFRTYNILPDQSYILDDLAEFIREYPEEKFELSGYTDNIGTDEDNILLSKKRVASVLTYLSEAGITSDHFVLNYFGSRDPAQPNDSEEGRQQNRRVEIRQIKSTR